MELTGPLCRAARALVQWPRERLAESCGITKKMVRAFENGSSELSAEAKAKIMATLEQGGAVFLEEDDMGAGVRLRFTARDVKQLRRLEGEGGAVGEDGV
jgi:transcriptional regulator with XRE-family HTH domain